MEKYWQQIQPYLPTVAGLVAILTLLKFLWGPICWIYGWVYKKLWTEKDHSAILNHRFDLRSECDRRSEVFNNHHEAIVRDVKRMNDYPSLTNSLGVSSWFKVELKGLYEGGIEAFCSSPIYVSQDKNGQWKKYGNADPNKVLVFPVGRIPFDDIVRIDWRGKEDPHIYCHYRGVNGGPFEDIPLYRESKIGDEPFYLEIEGYRPCNRFKFSFSFLCLCNEIKMYFWRRFHRVP